jgi:uncharacterized membrane protein
LRSDSTSRRHLSPPLWLWALILIYVVVYGSLSLVKHNNFHSFTLDLGIMSQVTWNTSHGRLFETSLDRAMDTELIGSYTGNHVRPVFLLLAPLYRLWPDPRMLLILQSVALALGAVPLFWIARRDLRSLVLQFGLIVTYLLYPALGFINLFDFHPVAFCVPALLFAYWALLQERHLLFWVMILLTLSTKEELIVPVAAFGVYCLLQQQWRKVGLWMLAIAVVWAFLCFAVVIPYYNEGRSYRFFELWSHLLSGGPGRGNGGHTVASNLLSVDAVYFVVHLLLPLGFLPLLGPGLLAVSLPSLAYLLVSSRSALHTVGFQYPAVLTPWLFLAAVHGLARLERWPRGRQETRAWLPLCLMLVGTLGANLPFNPIFVSWRSGYFMRMPHHEQIREALAHIPPQAGVATINPLGPHLVHRRYLIGLEKYPLPLNQDHLEQVDYVLLDLVDCRLFHTRDPRGDYAQMVREIIDTQQFGVRYQAGRILLLERGDPPRAGLEEARGYIEELEARGQPCWP